MKTNKSSSGGNLILVNPKHIMERNKSDMPLSLLYLSGAARDSGICGNIRIFDFNTPIGEGKTIDNLIALIDSLGGGGTVVGINCLYSALFPSVRKIAKKIKETCPSVKITTGGMHPTLFAKEIIDNCPEIDAVGIGESDLDFPKLLLYLFGEGDPADLEGVCLRIDGKTILKPRVSYIRDLDSLPRPGYEFFDFAEYAVDTSNWWGPDGIKISRTQAPILTSRSCPNQCNFCSMRLVMGDRFRARSAENVFEEIKYLYDTFGVNYFYVMDDNMTLNRERTIKICEMVIESGMRIYFDTVNGIYLKTLDKEVLGLMRRAGFVMVSLAVESGSDYIRNEIMGKRISREEILNAFELCHDEGMNTCAFFMIGMPEETEKTVLETIELLQEISVSRLGIHVAKPLPGTKLFEQCVRDNLLIGGFDASTLWTGEAEERFSKESEFLFKNLSFVSARRFWIKPYNLSVEKLVELDLQLQEAAYQKSKAWVEHVIGIK